MCAVDWHLLLEYLKVVLPPVAAVFGAVLVSRLGLQAFRRQKAIERKLDWYEQACGLLDRTSILMLAATNYPDQSGGQGKVHFDLAMEANGKLADVLGKSWLYADQNAHRAVAELIRAMQPIQARMSAQIGRPDAEAFAHACSVASLKLAARIRKDMGEAPLLPP